MKTHINLYTFQKRWFLSLFILLSFIFVSGFSFSSNLKLPKTEEEKKEFVSNGFKGSPAHFKWVQVTEGKPYSSPTNDLNALKKVKKIGIVGFNVHLYAKKKTQAGGIILSIVAASKEKAGIKPEELKSLTDAMYDDFVERVKKNGIEVITLEQVLTNEKYKKFEEKAKEGEVSGIWSLSMGWKASATARGLKHISALNVLHPGLITSGEEMRKNAVNLQELAKDLGVDAIVTVDNRIYLEASRFGGSYDLLFANDEKGPDGISIDVFSSEEARPIWSLSLAKAVEVPTEAGQENRLAAMAGWTKYEFGKVMGDIMEGYRTLMSLMIEQWQPTQ